MIDSIDHIELLELFFQDFNTKVRVCIDVDMSLNIMGVHIGAHRSPICSLEKFEEVANRVLSSKILKLVGVMGYEYYI